MVRVSIGRAATHGGLASVCLSLLGATACHPPPQIVANSALLPLSGACPETANSEAREFLSEVERLRLRVEGPGLSEPLAVEGDVGALTIDEVPAGEGLSVTLFGLLADGSPTWRGAAHDVAVVGGQDTPVEVLLTKVADLSCPRSPMGNQRSFHTATRLQDGRVLLVGGADESLDASSEGAGARRLTATATAEVYDPADGTFQPTGTLNMARMFHSATLLPDGRVAIVGGVIEVVTVPITNSTPFPIKPKAVPTAVIEVWDPTSGAFVSTGADPVGARVFHASALTSGGELLITGGIAGLTTRNDLGNALRESTLCDTQSLVCRIGPETLRARAGHSATAMADGRVLLWGGSVSTSTDPSAEAYKPEVYQGGSFRSLDPVGFANRSPQLNPFFAAAVQYTNNRVVTAGGLVRSSDGTFSLSALQDEGVTRGPVFIYDGTTAGDEGQVSAGPYGGVGGDELDPLRLAEPRFLGSAVPLYGNRALFAGGFAALDMTPSASIDLFLEGDLDVWPIAAGGQPRLLRTARGGLTATALGNGTVLYTGGQMRENDSHRPCANGEIFTDPEDTGAVR